MSLLCVDDLKVSFDTTDGEVQAVRDLSFRLERGESLAIVGESGSGKSQSMAAVLGLLAENGRASGSVRLDGKEILNLDERALRAVRGRRLSIVFQDPMTSLNPYMTIEQQLTRVLIEQRDMQKDLARAEVLRMLDAVRMPAAKGRLSSYPHEFSGGMRQRVMIAAALLCRPDVLIADEPTTALDVTVQASILHLLRELQTAFKTALLLISHDLGVVAGTCDRLIVMDQGVAIEEGLTDEIFREPATECTRKLLQAVPRLDRPRAERPPIDPGQPMLLDARDLTVRYRLPRGSAGKHRFFSAVRSVDLQVYPGETVGVVGESGCGKSSLARALMDIGRNRGEISYLGQDLTRMSSADRQMARRDMQFIFQDPLGSLDPRMTIEQIIGEPLRIHRLATSADQIRRRVVAMLTRVGLDESALNRYPHEFSGGQCQRIGIARALITSPRLLVCDEAVSALDVTVQASILKLLSELQRELSLGIVFIAHDLAVIRDVSDYVVVMYLGRIVEHAPASDLYAKPRHPYTRALLDAVPVPDPAVERHRERDTLNSELPSPWNLAAGCSYRSRCPVAREECASSRPLLTALDNHPRHEVACFVATESAADQPSY